MSLQADVALGNGQNFVHENRTVEHVFNRHPAITVAWTCESALCVFFGGNRAQTADSLFEDEELLGSC